MYVCMYIRMYVCMHVRMYVCMYVCMYVYMYVCMYVCMYSGVASLDLMLGHTFYNRPCLASYWNAGSYVHLYMAVVQKVHSMTNYL